MIAVTGNASRQTGGRENLFVGTRIEQLGLEDVAVRAYVCDGCDSGWSCAMISVAGRARRSAQVSAEHQRIAMHTLTVVRKLLSWNLVFLHVLRFGVAMNARSRDVHGIDFRA